MGEFFLGLARLIISSNLVGCSHGASGYLHPLACAIKKSLVMLASSGPLSWWRFPGSLAENRTSWCGYTVTVRYSPSARVSCARRRFGWGEAFSWVAPELC